jgi:uncharacterized protein YciI
MNDEPLKTYIYVLKLAQHLLEGQNLTEKEERIVAMHFDGLKKLLIEKRLILAGKTDGINEDTFGIVIFKANNDNEALEMMNDDPAVKQGIMTAKIYPYSIALMDGNKN